MVWLWGTRKRGYKLGTEVTEGKAGSFSTDERQSSNRFQDRSNQFSSDNIKFALFVRSLNEYLFGEEQTS